MNEKPTDPSNKRARTSKPKVRTGCITCKSKELNGVQCQRLRLILLTIQSDESNVTKQDPSARGAACDGYIVDSSPLASGNATPTPLEPDDLMVRNPVSSFSGSPEERRSFEFFRTRTSFQLSGFFDSVFWTRVVLQAAHQEPAVRHAILALSSIHERFEQGDKSILNPIWDRSEGGFALEQYNQAIQRILKPTHRIRQQVDICLIACMLFASFETLRGHHGSAMSHINSGVKILSEIEQTPAGDQSHTSLTISKRPFVELSDLEVLFNRLDSQIMLDTRPMTLGRLSSSTAPGFSAHIPSAFTSLEEGRNSFEYNWNGCIQLLDDVGDFPDPCKLSHYLSERAKYLHIFHLWSTAFDAFLASPAGLALSTNSLQGTRVLRILYIFAYTNLDACPHTSTSLETIWDKYLPHYHRAIALAEDLIHTLTLQSLATKIPVPHFSLEMNFVGPLYAVAHKCRDPFIRRRAVALLYATPRQEGIWDSFLAARVADKLIGIEEEGLGEVARCEDVPDTARLNGVEVAFDLSGRIGTFRYSRMDSPHATKRQDYVETIVW